MDATLPVLFGAKYQIHDGLVDITNASDRVTVSWNRFLKHDKVMLIGSSDNAPADVGRLRVTLHHNHFENVVQRAPRVRYGQVHVYNNYYVIPDDAVHGYSWGVGVQPLPVASGIFAENNFFRTERTRDTRSVHRALHQRTRHLCRRHAPQCRRGEPSGGSAGGATTRCAIRICSTTWAGSRPRIWAIDPTLRVPSLIESEAGPLNW